MPPDSGAAGSDPILQFVVQIRRRKVSGSYNVAVETVNVLRKVVAQGRWTSLVELIALLRVEGKKLAMADPYQVTISNVVRRALKFIRDELAQASKTAITSSEHRHAFELVRTPMADQSKTASTTATLTAKQQQRQQKNVAYANLKQLQRDMGLLIGEIAPELETAREDLVKHALEHLQDGDRLLTIGSFSLIEEVLIKAAEKRKNMVVYVVAKDTSDGVVLASEGLASRLLTAGAVSRVEPAAAGAASRRAPGGGAPAPVAPTHVSTIAVHVIQQAAVYAVMPSISKVLLGSCALFADGGLRSVAGAYTTALAASRFSVPVLAFAPFYKISPQFLMIEEFQNLLGPPDEVLHFSDGEYVSDVCVCNPVFDYIPADLISLCVTNMTKGNSPSYVYRLVSELYHPDDETF